MANLEIAGRDQGGRFKKGTSGNRLGKPKGTLTKRTREIAERCAAEGITPLEYLLSVLRDERQSLEVRLDAAKAAAPYMHSRLAAVESTIKTDEPIKVEVSWLE